MRRTPGTRPAERQRDQDEPRQHENRTRVDPHLESLGLDLVEHLQVLRGRGDEILQDLLHDLTAAIRSEDQHLDDAVARGIGEFLTNHFEGRNGSEHSRVRLEAYERGAQWCRARCRELDECSAQRSTGHDRRHEIAQAVGPGRLHCPEPSRSTSPEVAAREERHRDRRHHRDEGRAGHQRACRKRNGAHARQILPRTATA